MTAPTTTEERAPATQDSDEDPRFAHYVRKDQIVDASVFGTSLMTLCGFKLIPGRNPEKLPVCPPCKEALDNLRRDLS